MKADPGTTGRLLRAITEAQSEYIVNADSRMLFDKLLENLLDITDSEYGFIGEIQYDSDGSPYLKAHAITNIAWDEETRRFYEENTPTGLEFRNLKNLFGAVILGGEAVIANDPDHDPRAGGLPEGHPPLNAFLGIPFFTAGEMTGMVGIANRPGGYSEELVSFLQPFLITCSNVLHAYRIEQKRIRTGIALRESEERTRAILSSVLEGIISINEQGIIQSFNPAAERIFGYSLPEVLGRNVSILMPEPYRSSHHNFIANYLKSSIPKVIGIGREATGQRKNGEIFPAELAVNEVHLHGQRAFVGIIRDISERSQAEENRKKMLLELEKSHDNLLAILNQLRMATVMIDRDGRISFISDHCRDLMDIRPEKAVGSDWKAVCPFQDADKKKLKAAFSDPRNAEDKISVTVQNTEGLKIRLEIEIRNDPRENRGKILYIYDISEICSLRSQLENQAEFKDMIGNNPEMQSVFRQIRELAAYNVTVLVEGETGTGKELVASAIHSLSPRKDAPFIAVNCGGLTESLISSQLFGHKKGAFTGAIGDHKGVFEAAEGGTLFLDEIGELPLAVQSNLLRVLQEKEITRLGESQPRKVNVRLVAATNRDLIREADKGHFRKDLLYRIRVASLQIPPLRDRQGDIPLLLKHFIRQFRAATGKIVKEISQESIRILMAYTWPGNVRELKNAVESAFIRCEGNMLLPENFPKEIQQIQTVFFSVDHEDERQKLLHALEQTGGNRSAAARLLGMSRATFYRRLSEFNI